MTPLAKLLVSRISSAGPISVADYMTECLLHPEHGYYASRNPFGAGGDFITAPEVSQMYGEIIGLALARAWVDQGRPTPFVLAELGPGQGTCMADILRATRKVPGFADAARIHLVEASAVLRERQRRTLVAERITWLDSAATLPDAPLFLIANEFFDALPIRQYVRDGSGWRERLVGSRDGRLAFGLGGAITAAGGGLLSTFLVFDASIGLIFTMKALVIVIMGGPRALRGSIIAAFVLGLTETAVASLIDPGLTLAAAYVVFILVLLFRPQGILGRRAT